LLKTTLISTKKIEEITVIKISHLYKKFDDKKIFDDFSLEIPEKKITSILGPSGIGKSTLLKVLSGLSSFESGEIIGISDKKMSFIFQETRLIPWLTVEENIEFVLKSQYKDGEKIKLISQSILNLVELIPSKKLYPKELSGGMKQRVSLARAFAYPSDILLMDEPFQGLDLRLKESILNSFIKLWHSNNKTVIFVTHDIDEALLLSHRIYMIGQEPLKVIYHESFEKELSLRSMHNEEHILSKQKMLSQITG
jgi:NitT/TauT family transport system ATP-binding protein